MNDNEDRAHWPLGNLTPQELAEQASQAGLQKASHIQHGAVKFGEVSQTSYSQPLYLRTVCLLGEA
ncbi:hypothetical protein [Candidatus Nitrospira neomarina]|uniref:Uncharacterized protein n=1 Tax=Candidatus Nitrospira neomarina TaxID=3020899 RepID=A0AA96GRZ8_9BACT|nr:hypothetical protein [Candidatus Nitrospira neomarina]WNM63004.1 hypothetical protein PQG83_04425 [Candidatus Nitrospira neomarina]